MHEEVKAMKENRTELMPGVFLTYIPAAKFKTGFLYIFILYLFLEHIVPYRKLDRLAFKGFQ